MFSRSWIVILVLSALCHNFVSSQHNECGVEYENFGAPWKVLIYQFREWFHGADGIATGSSYGYKCSGVLIDNLHVVTGKIFFNNIYFK